MPDNAKRLLTPFLAAAALAALAPAARAQNPYTSYGPVYPSPYWGYNWDPYGGYLHGAASVIQAQSQYMVSFQQGRMIKEQVRSAKLDNRRKEIEQWLWERENIPTNQDERERFQRETLRYYRNNPSQTEIWSGTPLNELLLDLQKTMPMGELPPSPPLTEDLLAKINVTTGRRDSNIGLLKYEKLHWPLLLRRSAFAQEREEIEGLVNLTVTSAAKGDMDAEALQALLDKLTGLQKKLLTLLRTAGDEPNFSPTMYVDARGFLNQLNDGAKVLQQPDAVNYLNGKYSAQGKNVAELVKHMTDKGLRFSPVTPGNETAYTTLHRHMARFDEQQGSQLRTKAK